jgi:hypothetical protein
MLRILHRLYNRLTAESFTDLLAGRALLQGNNFYFYVGIVRSRTKGHGVCLFCLSGTHFCRWPSILQGLALPDAGKSIKYIGLIRLRTRDLPACIIVPQSLRYRMPRKVHS